MIVHYFICDKCGIGVTDADTKGIHKCPNCGQDMRWDVGHGIRCNYKHPVHSDALAINPDQRAEHEQRFPNVQLDKQCRPVFDNLGEHQKYLDATGFVKNRQKIKVKKETL